MAWGNFILDSGFDAAAALTKFRLVKLSAAETVTPVTAITDIPIGVSQFGCSAAEILKGKGGSIRLMGVSEVEAAGAIAVGQRCQLETTGRVSAEVGASGKRLVGVCVGHPSTNAGDRIAMLFLVGLGLA
jgi:hypothetical protein